MIIRQFFLQGKQQCVFKYQKTFLFDTLTNAKDTIYGKLHEFKNIHSIEDYQSIVPLSDYETLFPYIEQCMQGKQNILTQNTIIRFAQTAGTTGSRSKFIPVTNESLQQNHFKCSKDFLSIYLNNHPNSSLFQGRSIILAGGFTENPFTGQKNVGYISAILNKEKPWLGQYFTALDEEILSITDWERKIHIIADFSQHESITSIGGVGPWIVMLGEYIKQHTKKTIKQIWPDFELILSGGVNILLYIGQYRTVFGEGVHVYNMYNSSEGFYGFQIYPDKYELLLATHHAIFYEFIPMDQFQGISSKTITLDQVEIGKEYALVITTNAGLRRYIVGDTIRFTSLDPFMIQVSGRTQLYCNAFGEQIRQFHIIDALTYATTETKAIIKEYTVGPYFHENIGGLECLIEFSQRPKNASRFMEAFDEALQKINIYYAPKRAKNILILPPRLTIVPTNTFKRRMEKKGKLGGQNKIPNLWNDRKYLDELIEINNSHH